jgi:hypothetical protein
VERRRAAGLLVTSSAASMTSAWATWGSTPTSWATWPRWRMNVAGAVDAVMDAAEQLAALASLSGIDAVAR